ncbi:MAG: prenyltransferase [Bacteroidota bacterium]
MKIVKLFNVPALLLLAVAMFTFKYAFLDQEPDIFIALNHWQYALLVFACVLIAAGGFFMNNVFGVGKESHPQITEAKGYNIYIALNLIAIGTGYYIANYIGKGAFTGIFIGAAGTLYIYATSLKQTLIISNIIIALIIALPVVTIGIFTLYPVITPNNQPILGRLFDLMLDYAIFSFIIGLILTLVNDLANTDADYNAGLNTLPVTLGRARTVKIVLELTLIPVGLIVYYIEAYIINLTYAMAYAILFMLGPLVYLLIKLWSATTSKDFKHLEKVLQLLLLFVALSVAVLTYNINIKRNATEKTEQIQANTGIGFATQAAISA